MERNAGRNGDRGLVNAKLSVRQEEQQRRVNDIAQDRVTGRVSAEQGGGHDEGHNKVEDRSRGRAGWRAWQEGKTEWQGKARH